MQYLVYYTAYPFLWEAKNVGKQHRCLACEPATMVTKEVDNKGNVFCIQNILVHFFFDTKRGPGHQGGLRNSAQNIAPQREIVGMKR